MADVVALMGTSLGQFDAWWQAGSAWSWHGDPLGCELLVSDPTDLEHVLARREQQRGDGVAGDDLDLIERNGRGGLGDGARSTSAGVELTF